MFNYFNNNLKLLQKKDPKLAEYISNLKDPENIAILKTLNGLPTLKYSDKSNTSKYLHSPKDPEKEARDLLTDYAFKNKDGTILLGFGLGYLTKEISRKKERHHLLCVVESIPGLFKLALKYMDFSDILIDDDIFFFIGDRTSIIIDNFKPLRLKAVSGTIQKIALPAIMNLDNSFYDKINEKLHNHITSLRISFNDFISKKEMYLANLLENIPSIIHSSPVDNLKNIIKGNPAIVIAAGPTLTQEINIIKKRPANCFTISVDTALKPLLNNGIRPDLVVSCDPYSINIKKILGISATDLTIPLLFRADAQPLFIQQFVGNKYVVGADMSLANWLVNIGRKLIPFSHYQTVAHFGLLTAMFMSADPIILVGLDLSFPKDKDHADGCTAPWKIDLKKKFQWVPSNNGRHVKTGKAFASMIHMFENEIQKTASRCINTSKDGALIRGAEYMPLREALKIGMNASLSDPMPIYKDLLDNTHSVDSEHLKRNYTEAITWMISELNSLLAICHNAGDLTAILHSNTAMAKDKQHAIESLIHIHNLAFNHKSLLNIISDYLPRYLLSFCMIPKDGVPKVDLSDIKFCQDQIILFFEELDETLPMLIKHSLKILTRITKSSDIHDTGRNKNEQQTSNI